MDLLPEAKLICLAFQIELTNKIQDLYHYCLGGMYVYTTASAK